MILLLRFGLVVSGPEGAPFTRSDRRYTNIVKADIAQKKPAF